MEKVDRLIEKANAGLDRVKIIRRDRKLALRGSFPRKPGEGRGNRQRLISLGVFANLDGVKVAINRAQQLESDLNLERFDWADWERGGSEGERSAADRLPPSLALIPSTTSLSSDRALLASAIGHVFRFGLAG